ncbi:MAG: S-layer homology domain-containing protein [Lachnospiraceae bacterium]
MKKITVWRPAITRICAILLILEIIFEYFSINAMAAPKTRFKDVPIDYWAYNYIEKAYTDGALDGTDIFSPEGSITYAEFVAMLIKTFYPDRLIKQFVNENEEWYAPYLKTACERGILTNTLSASMDYGNHAIYRYDMVQIIVKLLEDKCVVLPSRQQMDIAVSQISDWNKVQEDKYWQYYVANAYAMGIFDGVPGWKTFHGAKNVTRAEAAMAYVRVSEMVTAGQNDSRSFQIIFEGDWNAITVSGYKESIEKEFYTVYPRLWARWGNAAIPKIIHVYAKHQTEMGNAVGLKQAIYDEEQRLWYPYISICIEFANESPKERILSHELTHVVQNYISFQSTWWVENMAGYGRFRYCAWADKEYMDSFDFYDMPDEALLTWKYSPNDKCHWFLAYLDNKYPTTDTQYGLIDAIHWAIRRDELKTDGGIVQNDETLNQIVKQITGYGNIELLRQQYRQELINKTWAFNGFYGYVDNYLTENLSAVNNPSYPTIQEVKAYLSK